MISSIIQFIDKHKAVVYLGVVNILAYGLFAYSLGFYGDDWGYIWLLGKGPGLIQFLSKNREAYIPYFRVLYSILGPYPFAWMSFMVLMRWVSSYGFWLILQKLWPEQKRAALMAAMLFSVYPGFYLSFASVNISVFIVLLACFFYSIYLNLIWEEGGRKRWWFLLSAVILALVNTTLAEYFFFMELVRPIILFQFYSSRHPGKKARLQSTLRSWAPFLIGFFIVLIWRTLYQSEINTRYSLALLEDIKAAPLSTIMFQIKRIFGDLFQSGLMVWIHAIYPLDLLTLPRTSEVLFIAVFVASSILLVIFQYLLQKNTLRLSLKPRIALSFITLGVLWFMISGWSIWIAKLHALPTDFVSTRFTLPFMPGGALIITGLILLIPDGQSLAFALLLSGALATQMLVANFHRRDWMNQEYFYRQLTTRFPGLEKGTMLLLSENPQEYGLENSVSAAVNWIFSSGNETGLDYYVYFNPDNFHANLGDIQPGQEIIVGHNIGYFTASLDRSVAIYLDSRNCMRVLYPGLDDQKVRLDFSKTPHDEDVYAFIRQYLPYTHPDQVLRPANPITQTALQQVFRDEPQKDWCWLYQVSDLESRKGNWDEIVSLADNYLVPNEYTKDKQKLLVFIEAYARMGKWNKAEWVMSAIGRINSGDEPVYCATYKKWLDEIVLDPEFKQVLIDKRDSLTCSK